MCGGVWGGVRATQGVGVGDGERRSDGKGEGTGNPLIVTGV